MINGQHTTVIIPVLNEECSLGPVIRDIPDDGVRILVVDNGSSDRPRQLALAAGAEVVCEPRKGYGNACLTGIGAAGCTDIIAFIDGDYSDYPADLTSVLEPLAQGRCDLSIGCRQFVADGKPVLPRHQIWGNRLSCFLIGIIHGARWNDLGPMRGIRRSCLERLNMQDRNFGWTAEMQIKAFRSGLRVLEIPVRYRKRTGQSKISGTLKGSVLAGCKILYWTLRLVSTRKTVFTDGDP
ncbi:MAG: glycosyltransferase family 2 protein [Gammaproteobacteria bacterium]|nr:glycosyltransferase family 2 protein [Gammaproteobacteria bacterium]